MRANPGVFSSLTLIAENPAAPLKESPPAFRDRARLGRFQRDIDVATGGTAPAPGLDIMSISECATRGLSILLIAALAVASGGWTAAGRDGIHCMRQQHPCAHPCAPEASLACRCHSLPVSPDTARLPETTPPHNASAHASLMEFAPAAPNANTDRSDVTSRHALQHLELRILHHTFLI